MHHFQLDPPTSHLAKIRHCPYDHTTHEWWAFGRAAITLQLALPTRFTSTVTGNLVRSAVQTPPSPRHALKVARDCKGVREHFPTEGVVARGDRHRDKPNLRTRLLTAICPSTLKSSRVTVGQAHNASTALDELSRVARNPCLAPLKKKHCDKRLAANISSAVRCT